jgi:diacylglycerol kinase family enzyme
MDRAATILSAEADQVLIAVNPRAGRRSMGGRVDRLVEVLGQQGLMPMVCSELDKICPQANQLHALGRLRALVGVGGDGTAAALVNRTDPGVPITLLPAGTANLLAKQFGLPEDPEKLGAMIKAGAALRLDAGLAAGRVFLSMIGCGFDAEVVERVHAFRRGHKSGHISYLSYLKPILQAIRSYRYPEIQIYCDEACETAADRTSPILARWVFACNLPRYGWGLPLAPAAVATDGLLDLCVFTQGSLWHGLRYVMLTQLGCHQALADCVVRRVRRFRMTAESPVAYQLDGDPGGHLPLDVEVLPGRLTLVVPSSPSI